MNKQDIIISLLKEIDKNIDNIGSQENVQKIKVRSFIVSDDCINEDGIWEGENIIDFSEAVTLRGAFEYCTKLRTIDCGNWDMSRVTDMLFLFRNCTSLQSIDVSKWNFSNVTGVTYMFANCTSLQSIDVSKWDMSNKVDISYMFANCKSLKSIDVSKWDVSSAKIIQAPFSGCTLLETIDVSNWDVSNATNMMDLFRNMENLKTLDLTKWDVGNVNNLSYAFYQSYNIKTLIGGRTIEDVLLNNISALNNIKVTFGFLFNNRWCDLDRASLRAVINGLADLTGQTAQTLILGETLIAKLTEEDIAIATVKNWTIA